MDIRSALPTTMLAMIAPLLASFSGDLDVGGKQALPFTTAAQAKLQTAKGYLSALDPVGAAEIQAALDAGLLMMGECNSGGFVGLTDGNTIQIKTKGVPAHVVAVRIAHEYMHWKYGVNGALGDCEHAAVYAQTLKLQSYSCAEGFPFDCSKVTNVKKQYHKYLKKCAGGNPIDPAIGQPFTFPPNFSPCCQ